MLLGSRYNVAARKFESFLTKLKDSNVRMFFPIKISKVKQEKTEKSKKPDEGLKIIDNIESNGKLDDLFELCESWKTNEFCHPFPFDWSLVKVLLEIASKFGEILPIKQEDHSFITGIRKICLDQNAYAILGFDSYFIITDPWKYWCSNELDFDKMTTAEYNKEEVLKQLGLTFEQIPLFIGLAGKKSQIEMMRQIFGPRRFFFENIAKFVKYTRTPIDFDKLVERIEERKKRSKYGENVKIPDTFKDDLMRRMARHTMPEVFENQCDAIGNYHVFAQSFALEIFLGAKISLRPYFYDPRFVL